MVVIVLIAAAAFAFAGGLVGARLARPHNKKRPHIRLTGPGAASFFNGDVHVQGRLFVQGKLIAPIPVPATDG